MQQIHSDCLTSAATAIAAFAAAQHAYAQAQTASKNTYALERLHQQCIAAYAHMRTALTALGFHQQDQQSIDVWVDGSWNPKEPEIAGWSFVGIDGYTASGHLQGTIAHRYAHISGELTAVRAALTHYVYRGYTHITIYHDYEGLSTLADGTSTGNVPFTREYAQRLAHLKDRGIQLDFRKIDADANRAHALAYAMVRRRPT